MPNLVLRTIIMIKKVYGAEICVFLGRLRGVTSGLSLSAVYSLFQPVSSISALYLHSITIIKPIMMIKKVYGAEICVFMAHLRGATSG